MPRVKADRVQIAIRVPREWLKMADELAVRLSPPGVTMTQTDAFRAAIQAGFDALADASPAKLRKR